MKLNKENTDLKTQIEKKQASDDKYSIRDRQTFENHFGHKARPAEEKYVQFLKMYENQAEKMRKEIVALTDTSKVLQSQVEELE